MRAWGLGLGWCRRRLAGSSRRSLYRLTKRRNGLCWKNCGGLGWRRQHRLNRKGFAMFGRRSMDWLSRSRGRSRDALNSGLNSICRRGLDSLRSCLSVIALGWNGLSRSLDSVRNRSLDSVRSRILESARSRSLASIGTSLSNLRCSRRPHNLHCRRPPSLSICQSTITLPVLLILGLCPLRL